MTITLQECIRRVNREIERTQSFPDSVGKREHLQELEEMLRDYQKQQAAGVTEL